MHAGDKRLLLLDVRHRRGVRQRLPLATCFSLWFCSMRPLWLALLLSTLLHAIGFGFFSLLRAPRVGVVGEGALVLKVEAGRGSGRLTTNGTGGERGQTVLEPTAATSSGGVQRDGENPRADARNGVSAAESGRYYSTEVLTRRPEALSEIRLRGEFVDGVRPADRAILDVWVEADGKVSRVEVVASDYSENLTAELRGAFGRLSFRPGEVDGRGVPVYLRIEASYGAIVDALQ